MGAVFSADGVYRYHLDRIIDSVGSGEMLFVMLNPSTADEVEDDPTIRRCKGFTKREGLGKLAVVNLYAYRATDPKELKRVSDPIGPENDAWLERASEEADITVAAWGANADLFRSTQVKKLLHNPKHLGLTKAGYPRHPLYLKSDTELTDWV